MRINKDKIKLMYSWHCMNAENINFKKTCSCYSYNRAEYYSNDTNLVVYYCVSALSSLDEANIINIDIKISIIGQENF